MTIAITQGGCGSAYSFHSLFLADEHPLIQYGDAFLSDHTDIPKNYKLVEGLQDLKSVLHRMGARERVINLLNQPEDITLHAELVWEELSAAQPPPDDHEVICNIIRQDRKTTRRKTMTTKSTAPENKEASEPKVKKSAFADTAKITFGTDKDGKPYSASKNNPKREGSKRYERFALYRTGMTVKKALEIGINARDLKGDSDKGLIVITE